MNTFTINYTSSGRCFPDMKVKQYVEDIIKDPPIVRGVPQQINTSQSLVVSKFVLHFLRGEIDLKLLFENKSVEIDNFGFYVNPPDGFCDIKRKLVKELNKERIKRL